MIQQELMAIVLEANITPDKRTPGNFWRRFKLCALPQTNLKKF